MMILSPDESLNELKKKPADFDVNKAAYWNKGEKVPFIFMAKALDEILKMSDQMIILQDSDLVFITEILCNMLRTVIETTPDDLLAFVYLLSDTIAPVHTNIKLGLPGKSPIKIALAEILGIHEKELCFGVGEDLASEANFRLDCCRLSLSLPFEHSLTVDKVFKTFHLIAEVDLDLSTECKNKKKDYIKSLLVAATDCEPRCLILMLERKLHSCLVEQALLTALGHAALYSMRQTSPPADVDNPLEKAAEILKQVYSVMPVYDKIVPALLSGGVWNLAKTCSLTPGIPCTPMKHIRTVGSVSEIFDKFQEREFICEYEYEGECAMIHYMENGQVEIYDPTGQRITQRHLDVIDAVVRCKRPSVSSFILECKIVPYDLQERRTLRFQELFMRRKAKTMDRNTIVNYCIYACDILYLNGQPLLQEQLKLRREHLYKSFLEERGFLQFAITLTSNDLEEIRNFLSNAVNTGPLGLIFKTLNSTYEPIKGSDENWLRLREGYMDSIPHSLYLVPIAALENPNGVCSFVLACYDSVKKKFQPMCTLGVQAFDTELQECFVRLQSTIIPRPMKNSLYPEKMRADIWFEPTEVWEMKGASLGVSLFLKGYSLHRPRFVGVLGDKNLDQVSSLDMVQEMYKAQIRAIMKKNAKRG